MTSQHVSLDKMMNYLTREVREKVTLNGLWPTDTDIKNKIPFLVEEFEKKTNKIVFVRYTAFVVFF